MELSAVGSLIADILVANKSICDVPNVMMVTAVTSSFRPTRQPKMEERSVMITTMKPM